MPFNYIDEYYWERYKSQILPIAERVDGFTIVANTGVKPRDTDKVRVVIHGKFRQKRGLPEMVVRRFISLKGLSILRKIYRRNLIAENFKTVDGDLVYGFSGGAYQQFVHIFLKQKMGVPAIHRMRGNAKLELAHIVDGVMRVVLGCLSDYTILKYDYHVPININYYNILRQYQIPKGRISRPIGLGVDCEKFKPCNSPDKFTIGYFGRLSPEKGTDFMLSLMAKTPDINYVVVGKDLIGVKFPENVYYHQPVHHTKIPKYYDLVDTVILPSYTEGVSNIFPESYASGKPVVCSHAAHDNSIPIYGYRLPHNIEAWRKTLTNMNQDTAREIGQEAREWALGYSWERFAEKMIAQFKKVLEND